MSAPTPAMTDAQFPDGAQVRVRRVTPPKVIANAGLIAIGFLFVLPLIWLLFASVDSRASWGVELPHLTFANFSHVLGASELHSLYISFVLASVATVVGTVAGTLAAYAFSRRRVPWGGPILLFVLFLSGVPITVMIVPIFQLFSQEGWLTVLPAAVFLGVTALPFEIWIIKNFIDAVPIELEEAARIEQAGTMRIIVRIVTPLALPGIGAAAIFCFVNAWGSFLIPLVLISDSTQQPAPITIYSFIGSSVVHYGDIAAFSILYSAPVVALYLILGRLFRGGFVLGGAVKG